MIYDYLSNVAKNYKYFVKEHPLVFLNVIKISTKILQSLIANKFVEKSSKWHSLIQYYSKLVNQDNK